MISCKGNLNAERNLPNAGRTMDAYCLGLSAQEMIPVMYSPGHLFHSAADSLARGTDSMSSTMISCKRNLNAEHNLLPAFKTQECRRGEFNGRDRQN
jgi:hypothetical protein